jgi:two-component system response regulator
MNKKNILLVEDNCDDQELIIRIIKKCNIAHNMVVANDGLEALDYLFAKGKYYNRDTNIVPTITMLDIKLPKISGMDVLKSIRNNEKTRILPVVMLTSSDEERDLIESYKLGANSYIHKPVSYARFQELLKQTLAYWLVLNVEPPNLNYK